MTDDAARIRRAFGVTDEEAAAFEGYLDASGYTAAREDASAQEAAFRDHLRAAAAETSARLTAELGLEVAYDETSLIRPAG